MFIRKVTRKYKDRVYTNYLLVRSVHTPKGPRQKVICSLGDLSPRPAEEWLRLAYAENLQQIRDRHLHYVIAARQPERDQWLDDFEDPQGFEEVHREPSPLNPFQKKSTVKVKQLSRDGERFVLCTSSQRVAKDRAIRQKQEGRFLADLQKLQRRIDQRRLVREVAIGEAIGRLKERYPRVARYHTLSYDPAQRRLLHEPNQEKKAKAELLDGGYLLRTDRDDLTAPEAWLLYMTLTRADPPWQEQRQCDTAPCTDPPAGGIYRLGEPFTSFAGGLMLWAIGG